MWHRRSILRLLALGALSTVLRLPAHTNNLRQGTLMIGSLHYRHPEHLIGDLHPFYHGGKWYLFYLGPGFHSKLMTSVDLFHWEPQRLSHEPINAVHRELAPYYVLGVFWDEAADLFRTYHGWSAGAMLSHTSTNLIHWNFAPNAYHIPPQYGHYSSQRDPYVFWNAVEEQYWCVMTCQVEGYDDTHNGAVGLASSPDLQRWEGRGDLYFPGNIREPEVPQVFHVGDYWYLLASIHTGEAVGGPSYWISSSPNGPWLVDPTGSLDGPNLSAANVGYDGQRWLLFGWIPLTTVEAHGRYTWGGHMAFPREIYPLANGALGVRLEPDFGRRIRGELLEEADLETARIIRGHWVQDSGLRYSDSDGDGFVALLNSYERLDIDVVVMPGANNRRVGLRLADLIDVGIDVIDACFYVAHRSKGSSNPYAMLHFGIGAERYELRVIVENDIVEMFVNNHYSLCARLPYDLGQMTVGLIASGGTATFHDVRRYHLYSMSEME